MTMKKTTITTLIVLVLGFADSAVGSLLVHLPGNTEYEGWSGLTSANNPGYPGFADLSPWPNPIFANGTGSAGWRGFLSTTFPEEP